MEYYICLEEDRICYVRGRFKRCAGSGLRRCLEIVEWEFVEPVPDVASALTRLAEKYGMEGKRVNLIAGRDVRMMSFAIPKAGKNAMKRMAVNEMSLLDPDFGNHAAALDLRRKPAGQWRMLLPTIWNSAVWMRIRRPWRTGR